MSITASALDIPEVPYSINEAGVHPTIQNIPRFVVWDPLDLNPKTGKPTKQPLQTNGRLASTTDAKTWCTYQEAIAVRQYRLGWVGNDYSIAENERLSWETGQVLIDLDDCILPNGELTEWSQKIVAFFTRLGALIERSPSGNGFHIFCRGKAIRTGKKNIDDAKRELGPDSKEKIEIYDHTSPRYFTITGHILSAGNPEAEGQEGLDWLFDEFGWADEELEKYSQPYADIERAPVESIDLIELEDLLSRTPSDDNWDWILMGYALKGAAKNAKQNPEFWDQKFFEIWDTWSATSHKYVPGECARRWWRKDFVNSRSGISTVYRIANKYGNKRKSKYMEAQSNINWQDPEPLIDELLPVPPLMSEMLPEPYRMYVIDESERMSCPPEFVAAALLTITGSLIGTACGIKPKRFDDWLEVPNLWGGIVATPGQLKSPAIEAPGKFLSELEKTANQANELAMQQHLAEYKAYDAQEKALLDQMKTIAKETLS